MHVSNSSIGSKKKHNLKEALWLEPRTYYLLSKQSVEPFLDLISFAWHISSNTTDAQNFPPYIQLNTLI